MDTSYFAYDWKEVPTEKPEHPYIVINTTSAQFCARLAEHMQPYIEKGYTVYYVPVSPQDADHIKPIEAYLQHTISLKILEREQFDQFIHILKQSEKVICTRLHLFLVASFLGIPTEIFISPMKVATHQHKLSKMQEVIKKVL
jgi:ADP-heptose:LPS heptosyltransferase